MEYMLKKQLSLPDWLCSCNAKPSCESPCASPESPVAAGSLLVTEGTGSQEEQTTRMNKKGEKRENKREWKIRDNSWRKEYGVGKGDAYPPIYCKGGCSDSSSISC